MARVEQDGLRGVLTGYLVDSLISTGRFEDARACLVIYPTASESWHRSLGMGSAGRLHRVSARHPAHGMNQVSGPARAGSGTVPRTGGIKTRVTES